MAEIYLTLLQNVALSYLDFCVADILGHSSLRSADLLVTFQSASC
jgi:hypothetical protein